METVKTPPEKSAKRMGWAVLAIALASPIVMSWMSIISAYKAGELTVQVGFAWLAAALVIDLLTRKRDAISKANGRIVAAVLALILALVMGFNVYRDDKKVDTAKRELIEQFMAATVDAKSTSTSQVGVAPAQTQASVPVALQVASTSKADREVVILNAMRVRAKQFAEETGAIDRRFAAIDLDDVLLPQTLMSKVGLDASRKKLNSYKAAIAERDAVLKKHFVSSEQIIRGSGLSEREVNEDMDGFNSSKGPISQNYADLTLTQLATVKATEDIFDFAQRALGRITVQNGQLMFQTQPELDEYGRLVQALTDVASKETVATQKVQAQAQKSKQALVDQLK